MNSREAPGVRMPLPPPLLFLLALAGGVGLGHRWPMPLPGISDSFRLLAAAGLGLASFALGGWAMGTLWRRKASPEFHRPVHVLVTEGPYRFTRNPLYVALSALLACFAGMLDSLWILGELPLLILVLDRVVIAREEAYLRSRFGAAYADYVQSVRRWL